ncbi:hypothetical protein [Streptomyces sp. NRRL B-3648]|uniref:hypothetical protein n=1 Tax=Streptomyces sp. NRRL B-3648 TaxID=1519493 RepID=UPI0006ADFA27|nr:hypothetical protein [Streptomyces sp. NRRL B-3648]
MKKIMLAVAVSLLVAGCSSASGKTQSAESKKATSTVAVESPTEQTEGADAPDPVIIDEIDCSGEYYSTAEEAWAAEQDVCDATLSGTEMSDTEIKAVQVAYGDEESLDSLAVLYGICAQSGSESWSYLQQAGSKEQLAEVRGALLLCPDHPDKSKVEKLVGSAANRNKLEGEGRVFGNGVYRVGSGIQPGAYYVLDVEGCYWERTDANGETIDNNFISEAKRVQVTIRASDYSFNSESCGQWQPVGS